MVRFIHFDDLKVKGGRHVWINPERISAMTRDQGDVLIRMDNGDEFLVDYQDANVKFCLEENGRLLEKI